MAVCGTPSYAQQGKHTHLESHTERQAQPSTHMTRSHMLIDVHYARVCVRTTSTRNKYQSWHELPKTPTET